MSRRLPNGGASQPGEGTIVKFGQYPSHADLQSKDLKKHKGVVDQIDISEINRAMGLASVGVSIGAFVYFRRVFERFVLKSFERAQLELTPEEFASKRMAQKIEVLENNLPKFIYENREIYSILSKGIHELSEQQCAALYDLMHESIFMILDEEKERVTKEERAKKISASLKNASKQA